VTAVRSVVERYYDAFNAHDWDAWAALLDEDVEITIEGDTLQGRCLHAALPDAHYVECEPAARRAPASSQNRAASSSSHVAPLQRPWRSR
jgi:hypothetical protein